MANKDIILSCMPVIASIFFDDEEERLLELAMLRLLAEHFTNREGSVFKKNYAVVPMFSSEDFKSHFRLNRKTFEVLLSKICEFDKEVNVGRPPISTEKQLLCVLWFLATQESYRSVADRFDISKSTLHSMVNKICHILAKMAPSVICWPNISNVKNEFESICGFPDVVGAIDGTHIYIKAPPKQPLCYYNRKGNYSITLQAVCTPNLAFTDTFCSFPGSVDDARVLRNSLVFDNENYFPNNSHLVGDCSYPLHTNLMVPYKDNSHLTSRQINFNRKLSKTRDCAEKALTQLKDRFRRLKFFDVGRVDMLPLYVLAACVLHNVCIKEDFISDSEGRTSDKEEVSTIEEEDSSIEATNPSLTTVAENKRDFICDLLN